MAWKTGSATFRDWQKLNPQGMNELWVDESGSDPAPIRPSDEWDNLIHVVHFTCWGQDRVKAKPAMVLVDVFRYTANEDEFGSLVCFRWHGDGVCPINPAGFTMM